MSPSQTTQRIPKAPGVANLILVKSHMSKYHHTTIKHRPLRSNPDQAKPVAEVVFEAENSHTATSSILDALDTLGIPKADSATLTEFGRIERLDSFPFGLDADKPDWSNESVKVWLIDPPN